jgi:UDP-N-acetylmuramoyl-tripeptide--D-alanyl-D-alanine ligase
MNETISKIHKIFLQNHDICTDSRAIKENDIFFALKGGNFNGNLFVNQALEKGAAFAVCDELQDVLEANMNKVFVVEDVLESLQQLASYHAKQSKAKILAIGGSNGKTTTKELIHEVLKTQHKVIATQGNFNNQIGVPLTLLKIEAETEIAIVEMGTNHPGEMQFLVELADPDLGLVTNIGKEHLEGFGDIEAVAKEESFLYHYLALHKRLVFVNADDVWLGNMAKRIEHKVTYGLNNPADYYAINSSNYPYASILWNDISINSKLAGEYNTINILAALAVGQHFSVTLENIKRAIEAYEPDNKRSQWITKGDYELMLDCYNANPDSMKVALLSFSKMNKGAVILGDMLELGEAENQEHQEILAFAQSLDLDAVYTVGPRFSKLAKDFNTLAFEHVEDLKTYFLKQGIAQKLFLIKGSRGIQLEKVLEVF